MNGWTGHEDWTVSGGTLLSRGELYSTQASVFAPLDLDGVDDYAVEAEIQLVTNSDAGAFSGLASFGVVARADDQGVGYGAGRCTSAGIYSCVGNQPADSVALLWSNEDFDQKTLDAQPFTPGTDWHSYRLEVRGNTQTVRIDDQPVLSATDNSHLAGGHVGLWSYRTQVAVRSFAVTPLSPDEAAAPPPLPYRADWTDGLAGWGGTRAWAAQGGILTATGEDDGRRAGIVAPLDLADLDGYVGEAELRLLRYLQEGLPGALASFGVVVRGQEDGTGYGAGHCAAVGRFVCTPDQPGHEVAVLWTAVDGDNDGLDVASFDPGREWHRYRVEVRGNTLSLSVDGHPVLQATDNSYLDGRRAGLWSSECQIEVRRFEVSES